MSHMICLECGEVYDPLYIKSSEFDSTLFCPKLSCGGRVIECDDLIMPVVYTLNRKGYITFHSCSGHPGGKVSDAYVSFNCLVTDMDKVINTIIGEYNYSCKTEHDGKIYFSVVGCLPGEDSIYEIFTRPACFENWDEVKVDFEKLKGKCVARNLYPVLLVHPYVDINGAIYPAYKSGHIKNYPVSGFARHALYDINSALYEMATRLPDELSLEDL